MNDHPLAVDVADLQARQFSTPHAGGIERHQYDAMKRSQCRVDQASDLLLTENDRQLQHFLGIGSFGHAPRPLECLDVEEAQGRQPLVHRIRRQLHFLNNAAWYSRMCCGPNCSGERWKYREKCSTVRT